MIPMIVKDQLLALSGIKQVIAAGDTKVSVVLDYEYDISVDFRIVKDKEFITTLHHFTGSKDHNVRMRQLAKDAVRKSVNMVWRMVETGEVLTFETEEQFYHHFGLPFIPPELREDGTEVEQYDDMNHSSHLEAIQGDLHMHTTWSDGAIRLKK